MLDQLKKNKKGIVLITSAVIVLIFIGIFCGPSSEQDADTIDTVFKVDNLWNGDAKFYNDDIITNVDGKLTILDRKGQVQKNMIILEFAGWILWRKKK